MEELSESLLNKKIDSYKYDLNDFEAKTELMVTITLNEYRSLIKKQAEHDYQILKKWKLKQEIEKLNEEIQRLKTQDTKSNLEKIREGMPNF